MRLFLPLSLVLLPVIVTADVAIDSATAEQGAAAAAITFQHTVGAGADELVVCGSNIFGSAFNFVSATFNGDALVQVSSSVVGGTDSTYMWRLSAPDAGTHDVVLTWDGTGAAVYGYAASFTGVDTDDPVDGTFNVTGTGAALSQAATSSAGGMVMDCGYVSAAATPGTEGAGQTVITNDDILPSVSSYESASGASTTMSWGLGASVDWAHFGIALAPEGGAGAPSTDLDSMLYKSFTSLLWR